MFDIADIDKFIQDISVNCNQDLKAEADAKANRDFIEEIMGEM